MATTRDTLAYILHRYPRPEQMSNARATKTVYLADWRHAITYGRQITPIQWYFDNFGPFVWDIKEVADTNRDIFSVINTTNSFGGQKTLIKLRQAQNMSLSSDEIGSIEHTIRVTAPLGWEEFMRLVYSTYPIVASDRYSNLDLPSLARDYKRQLAG